MLKSSIVVVLGLTLLASGCSGKTSTAITAMQKKDKMLTCKEILLEMNEAEFYKSTAEKNKGPDIQSVLMPLGYISTYMSAEDAIASAKARVDYLDRIYQIMECDTKRSSHEMEGVGYAPIPQGYMMEPVPMPPMGVGAYPYVAPVPGQVRYRHEENNGTVGFYPEGMYW